MSSPPPAGPSAPENAPEKRIRRGCLAIVFLLLMVVGFNFIQYGANVVVLIGGGLLLLALIAMVMIWRE